MSDIEAIIAQLRVPDLPYPVGRGSVAQAAEAVEPDWRGVLSASWSGQIDTTVIELLRGRDDVWSSRQVNAAYLADRIMDVFLRTSGLHYSLVSRAARLRFYLAWLLHRESEAAIAPDTPLRRWLDHLITLRGWSDGDGRSAKHLLKRLDGLVDPISAAFQDDTRAFEAFVTSWFDEDARQAERNNRLQDRLLETEQGAARQRAADLQSQHRVAQALDGHRLPVPILELIEDQWQPLLRQVILTQGLASELWRKAGRCMDWLIWAMDPGVSNDQRDRLYQVAEEIPDRFESLWLEVFQQPLPEGISTPLQEHLVMRLRGESLDAVDLGHRPYDGYWLKAPELAPTVAERLGQWLVSGAGAQEQRRWLFAYFDASGEVLWTNGQGVKQGLEPAYAVAEALADGSLKPLPDPQPFESVLQSTVSGLSRVLDSQRKQRRKAAERARAEAEALRLEREEAARKQQVEARERARKEEEAEAARELAASQAEQARIEAEQAKRLAAREQRRADLLALVDQLQLGAWVEIRETAGPLKLKLAVRINASGKLIFVDRLGLNKREINRLEMADLLLSENARLLNKGAEFDETLSRVVGRIRVGR